MIDKCPPCQAAGPGKPPAPLKPSELPPSAWHTLKADFLGPIPGTHQSTGNNRLLFTLP